MKMKVFKKVVNMEVEAEDGAGVEEAETEVEAEEEAGAEEETGSDLGRPNEAVLIRASFQPLRVAAYEDRWLRHYYHRFSLLLHRYVQSARLDGWCGVGTWDLFSR